MTTSFETLLAESRSLPTHIALDQAFRAFYGADFLASEMTTPERDKAGADVIVHHRLGRSFVQVKGVRERGPESIWFEYTDDRGREGWLNKYNPNHADLLVIIYYRYGVAVFINVHDLDIFRHYVDRHREEFTTIRPKGTQAELVSFPLPLALYACNGIRVVNFTPLTEKHLMPPRKGQQELYLERRG